MSLTMKGVSLNVLDSERDAGRGVVRVDSGTMEALGASAGDILEVLGRRRTVAKCLPIGDDDQAGADVPPEPAKGAIAKVDWITRENAQVSIGDTITLRRVRALPANYAEVMPLDEPPGVDARYIELALNGVPVSPGDVVMIPQAEPSGKERYFRVISLEPASEQAILMVSTIFRIVRETPKGDSTI